MLLWVLLAGSPAVGQQWAEKMFETTTHDFGSVARQAQAESRFVLTNIYLEDVHVASARPSCGCISTGIEQPLLKTYEKGAIVATLDTRAYRGRRDVTITVTIDRPFYAQVQLHVDAYIRDDVLVEPGAVVLGTVDRGAPVEKTISVTRTGRSDWRILAVRSPNPHLSAEVVETTRQWDGVSCRLRVRLDPEAPVGPIRDHLVLLTNESQSTGIPVLVEGRVASGVTITPDTLFLGVVEPGETVTRKLIVRSKDPFRVTAVTSDGDHFQFPPESGDPPKPLHVIPITFVAGRQAGKVVERIRIHTDLDEAPPELATYAVVRSP
ncbi:MAG: hypothetical protein A2V98_06890 [Planctomycetes bacterium RBG_16_64_12]|nr:MAG: hypothetical protein A2V98_06890 [Planctomycetes bacterium RBG_16_64_12]